MAFEEYSRQRGVKIKSYQADNGIFRNHKWMDDCHNKNQPLTFTGVNAHHQNGVDERRSGLLQEHARAMIIHVHQKWPGVVTSNLWPYTIRMANDCLNETPNLKDNKRRTAEQIFSDSLVQPNMKHHKVYLSVRHTYWMKPYNKGIYSTSGKSNPALAFIWEDSSSEHQEWSGKSPVPRSA